MQIRRGDVRDLPVLLDLFDEAVEWLVSHGNAGQWGTEPFSTQPRQRDRVAGVIDDGELWIAEVDAEPAGALVVSQNRKDFAAARLRPRAGAGAGHRLDPRGLLCRWHRRPGPLLHPQRVHPDPDLHPPRRRLAGSAVRAAPLSRDVHLGWRHGSVRVLRIIGPFDTRRGHRARGVHLRRLRGARLLRVGGRRRDRAVERRVGARAAVLVLRPVRGCGPSARGRAGRAHLRPVRARRRRGFGATVRFCRWVVTSCAPCQLRNHSTDSPHTWARTA